MTYTDSASAAAAAASASRAPAGVSGFVVDKGNIDRYVPYLCQGLKHGMQDAGANSLDKLHRMREEGALRFEMRSAAAVREGGVHGLYNYQKQLYTVL